MSNPWLKKFLASLQIFLLVLAPQFTFPLLALAQESSESAQTVEAQTVLQVAPSPSPELTVPIEPVSSPEPSPSPEPTSASEESPAPSIEPSPSPIESSPPPAEIVSDPLLELIQNVIQVPVWTLKDGVYTSEILRHDVVYKYPGNEKLAIKFTKLPLLSGTITVKEHEVPQNVDKAGSKDYEITSTMQNGSFSFDLTLPTNDPGKEVLSSQDGQNYDTVNNEKVVSADTITIKGVTHLTHFIVGDGTDDPNHPIINEFVSSPSSGNNEWVELLNTTNSPINLTGWKFTELNTPQSTPVEVDLLSLSGILPAHGILVFDVGTTNLNNTGDSIGLSNGTTVVDRVTYGTVVSFTTTTGLATSPSSSQSAVFDGTVWSISATPTKGWFNDAGQSGKAPLLSTIDSTLSGPGVGITSNIGELTDPSATPATEGAGALYFEKTGQGKIVFEKVLNMSDQATVNILQSLGTAMEMSNGHIKFDSTTATAMVATGAKIYMNGLSDFNAMPNLIVKNDVGTTIDPSDASNYPTIVKSWDNTAKTLTFTTSHFTQFDVEKPITNDTTGVKYATIQAAIDAATTGNTISIAAGTYVENVSIDAKTNLTIQGVGASTIIEPASGIGFAIKNSDGITIKKLKIHTTGTNAHGIWIPGDANSYGDSDNITIQDNTIVIDGASTGIYAEQVNPAHNGWTISGNSITANNGMTAELYDVTDSQVTGNTFDGSTSNSNVIWSSELSNLSNLIFNNNTVSDSTGSQVAFITDFIDYLRDDLNVGVYTNINTVTANGNTFNTWGSRAIRIGSAIGTGTVTGITISSNTFNMTTDTTEVIGGTAGSSATGTGNTFNVSGTAKIQKAIDAARDGSGTSGDVIKVSAGTYTEDLTISSTKTNLELSGTGSPTIKGVATVVTANYPQAVPNIEILASGVKLHGFTIEGPNYSISTYSSGMLIGASNVEIYSNSFKIPDSNLNTDFNGPMSNGIQTWSSGNKPGVDISGLSIHDNTFTSLSPAQAAGYEGIYLNLDTGSTVVTIKNNTFTGNIARAITTERSKTTISNNTVTNDLVPSGSGYTGTGGWQGINIGGANSGAMSNIIVSGNTVKGSASNKGFSYGIKLGYTTGSTFSTVSLTNNNVYNAGTAGIWNRITATGILANNNDLANNTKGVQNDDTVVAFDATKNWWGSTTPDFTSILSGLVSYDPWYTNLSRTTLSNNTATDATFTSTTTGQADLPSGVTSVALSDTTVLDVSSSLNTASGDSIMVKGAPKTLSGYVGGDLTGTTNLSLAQSVGGVSVSVNKAVNLQSGTDTQAITLTNSNLSNVSVAIPDNTTVLGTSGWDGKITPPKTGSSSGSAPSGFSVGSTVIEVGSSTGVLLFDQPVIITLTGVTGNVGYKPAGSTTWTQITTACGGTYASPAKPTFPGECYISDGSNTRIYTYHFTTFGSLDTVSTSSGSSNSSSSASSAPVCTDTKPASAPTLLSAQSESSNTVTLTWSKASDPVTYYLVAYGNKAGEIKYGNPNVGGKDTTSYTVKGLSGGTYYFRVRSGNNCMPGDYSNELAVNVGGGELNGSASGFEEGVLGEEVEEEVDVKGAAEQAGTAAAVSKITKGLFDNKLLLGLVILVAGGSFFYLFRRK